MCMNKQFGISQSKYLVETILSNLRSLFFCIDSQSKRNDERLILQRLFQYSLPDWKIITFGTIILLSAALCKYYSICINKIKMCFLIIFS